MEWGHFFTKVNFMTFLWEDPCDAPWTVYVETALPAALELFAQYYAIDLSEIQKSKYERTLNPYRLRSNRKGNIGSKKTRSRWRRRLGALISYDPNEGLGRRLSPMNRPNQTIIASGRATLFIIGGVLERLAWWWFVANLIFDFLFNWTTALLKTEACQDSSSAVCLRQGSGQIIAPVAPWQSVRVSEVIKQRGAIASSIFSISVFSGYRWVAMGSVDFVVLPGSTGGDCKVRLIDSESGKQYGYKEFNNLDPGDVRKAEFDGADFEGATVMLEIDCTGVGVETTNATLMVMAKEAGVPSP